MAIVASISFSMCITHYAGISDKNLPPAIHTCPIPFRPFVFDAYTLYALFLPSAPFLIDEILMLGVHIDEPNWLPDACFDEPLTIFSADYVCSVTSSLGPVIVLSIKTILGHGAVNAQMYL